MSNWMALFAAALMLGIGPSLVARPAGIVILRHAEKPADDKNAHLSSRGVDRAIELAKLLPALPAITNHAGSIVLIAPHPTTHAHGLRCLETLEPTARRLHLAPETRYAASDWRRLARELLTSPAYDGKTVVVCWVHDDIPALAKALGVKNVPSWSGKTFDRLWFVSYARGHAKLDDQPQHLLPGDSPK